MPSRVVGTARLAASELVVMFALSLVLSAWAPPEKAHAQYAYTELMTTLRVRQRAEAMQASLVQQVSEAQADVAHPELAACLSEQVGEVSSVHEQVEAQLVALRDAIRRRHDGRRDAAMVLVRELSGKLYELEAKARECAPPVVVETARGHRNRSQR